MDHAEYRNIIHAAELLCENAGNLPQGFSVDINPHLAQGAVLIRWRVGGDIGRDRFIDPHEVLQSNIPASEIMRMERDRFYRELDRFLNP